MFFPLFHICKALLLQLHVPLSNFHQLILEQFPIFCNSFQIWKHPHNFIIQIIDQQRIEYKWTQKYTILHVLPVWRQTSDSFSLILFSQPAVSLLCSDLIIYLNLLMRMLCRRLKSLTEVKIDHIYCFPLIHLSCQRKKLDWFDTICPWQIHIH